MYRQPFEKFEYYHIYNRGVDKRNIFEDETDYLQFLFRLATFNDKNNLHLPNRKLSLVKPEKPYVGICLFTLLPNHYHFLVINQSEKGVSKIMQRLQNGYTKYFNHKYHRTGSLFESAYQCKHIGSEKYLEQIIRYISLNHLECFGINWKNGIDEKDVPTAKIISTQYPWSSTKNYLNKKQDYRFLDVDFTKNIVGCNFSEFLFGKNNLDTNMDIGCL